MLSHEPLVGPRVKLERADEHIKHVENILEAFYRANPQRVVEDSNPNYALKTRKVVQIVPLPNRLVCVVGDAIHNMRSALDHLAFAVAATNGVAGNALAKVSFTIRNSANDFRTALDEMKVRRIGGEWIEFLREVEPFDGGKRSELVAIRDLDNIDKHRNLVVVKSVLDAARWEDESWVTVRARIPADEGIEIALDPSDTNFHTATQARVVFGETVPGLDLNAWANIELRRLSTAVAAIIKLAATKSRLFGV